jgi:propionyl-CoA synthetase
LEWYTEHIPIPAVDHWWQKNQLAMIANMIELNNPLPGSVGKAVYDD